MPVSNFSSRSLGTYMEITNARKFSRRMNFLIALFALGVVMWTGPGLAALFILRPIDPYVPYVLASTVIGFVLLGISSFLRSSTPCPACHNSFCGPFNDPDSSSAKNVFALSCRHCGYKVNGDNRA